MTGSGAPEIDLGSRVGVGMLDDEVFVTVIPPLSDREVDFLVWADIATAEEVFAVDESAGIVGMTDQPEGSSKEERISETTRKAARIAQALNQSGLREDVTIISPQPVDFTGRLGRETVDQA